jgi:hypothetical protein
MAKHPVSPEKLQEIRELAAGWGKIIARRVLEETGSSAPLDFCSMEQLAATAAQGLTEGTLTTLLGQQAQTLATEQPCPACGRLCLLEYEDRPLTVKGGQLSLHEPVCHCPDCRRDFFPPPAAPASGQPRLQPHRPADDR